MYGKVYDQQLWRYCSEIYSQLTVIKSTQHNVFILVPIVIGWNLKFNPAVGWYSNKYWKITSCPCSLGPTVQIAKCGFKFKVVLKWRDIYIENMSCVTDGQS